jgi:hypothetical protein
MRASRKRPQRCRFASPGFLSIGRALGDPMAPPGSRSRTPSIHAAPRRLPARAKSDTEPRRRPDHRSCDSLCFKVGVACHASWIAPHPWITAKWESPRAETPSGTEPKPCAHGTAPRGCPTPASGNFAPMAFTPEPCVDDESIHRLRPQSDGRHVRSKRWRFVSIVDRSS